MTDYTALYKVWVDYTGETKYDDAEQSAEDNAQVWVDESGAYLGQFDTPTELAEHLVDESGSASDFWGNGLENHHLAPYFKFDYEAYARDLLYGDVWSVSIDGLDHYFFSNY